MEINFSNLFFMKDTSIYVQGKNSQLIFSSFQLFIRLLCTNHHKFILKIHFFFP